MSSRYKDKGRIPGQYTAIRWEILDSAAWKQMSMGARLLYIALIKPLSFNRDNNGKIFLSTRHAAKQLGAKSTDGGGVDGDGRVSPEASRASARVGYGHRRARSESKAVITGAGILGANR